MAKKRKIVYRPTPTLAKFHMDDSFVRCVMGPVGCYTGDMEYLTPDGWRRFADGAAPLVAQYDPATSKVSFVEPEEWIINPSSKVYEVHHRNRVQVVTGDHKCGLFDPKRGWQIFRPTDADLPEGSLVTAAEYMQVDRPRVNISDELLRVQVLLLLHARWGRCWNTRLNATLHFDQYHEFVQARRMLSDAGLCFVEVPDAREIRFRAPWRLDVLPQSWWQGTDHQLRVLFETFAQLRDGLDGSFEYATNDRRVVDWLQYAAFFCGWSSHVLREGSLWVVFCQRGSLSAAAKPVVVERSQPEPTYCFKVPSGWLVVRHNGHVFVSGNSGKTVGCLTEILYRAFAMPPGKDGVRRSRGLVGRRTYPQLKTTTIQTWNQWYGPLGEMRFDSPITWRMRRPLEDGTVADVELYFMPLDGPVQKVADKLKSLELTYAYLNEASELDGELIPHVISRLKRYPPKDTLPEGAKPWYGLWMDTNPPSTTSWIYTMFEIERPKGWRMFRQPGALMLDEDGNYVPNPEAENVENHVDGYNYWLDMIPSMSEPQIRSLVLGEYAPPVSGRPVYPTFSARRHVADHDLRPYGRMEIIIGCDWGLNPAAAITGMTRDGQLQVFEEIVPEKHVLLEEFVDKHLLPVLYERYRNFPVLLVGDPSGQSRNQFYAGTVFTYLQSRGLAAEPAITNAIAPRIAAVDHFLRLNNGFLMSPSCTVLREGFEGGYVYKRTSKTKEVYSGEPEKNEFSHVHDALQYAALKYYNGIVKDLNKLKRHLRRRSTVSEPKRRALV